MSRPYSEKAHYTNMLKCFRFDKPDVIPVTVGLSNSCWNYYPKDFLIEQIEKHPYLFYDPQRVIHYQLHPMERTDSDFRDAWGTVWRTSIEGIIGVPIFFPLASWDALATYQPPDPNITNGIDPLDWATIERNYRKAAQEGWPLGANLPHGHTFLRLTYLRGYENTLYDMAENEPRLWQVLEMIQSFNLAIVDRYVSLDIDGFSFPEDLGMQKGPMLSPSMFCQYIEPIYRSMFERIRRIDGFVHMHCDGDIRTLVPHLLRCGVTVLNLQDQVNGVEWIAENVKGKAAIDLDLDRQELSMKGDAQQFREYLKYCVQLLGDPHGGLMFTYGIYPPMPQQNISAFLDALQEIMFYYADTK